MRVRINDVELDVQPGTSVIDAVFAAGYDVPYFCSQEYMSPIGACRMCLAKVGAPRKDRGTGEWILDEESGERKIFWFPNLMATCTAQVMEGMVVDTLSDETKRGQDGMVEFTLINHPLDCPTCDKGGACELQDRAYEYGSGRSRFQFDKRHQEKHALLSNAIVLDRERCIHCKRCVRYFEEVPGDGVLDFIERGGHTYIGTADPGLPSNFTGNITDICPVGALLDRTSRFRGRNWEYDHTDTTSLDDAGGAALRVDARTGRIERIKARLHPEVNKTWIDDGSRFGHEYADAPDRLTLPLVRKDGELVPSAWEEALQLVAQRLRELEPKTFGIAVRADATLEEGVAAKALAAHLGTGRLDHAPRPPASVIPDGAAATLEDVAGSDALFVIGDVTEEVPIVDLRIKDALKGVPSPELLPHGPPIADLRLKERMPRKREILTVAAPYRVDLMKHAGRAVEHPAGGEAALLGALAALARGEEEIDEAALAMPRADAEALVAQLTEAERPVLVWGAFVLADPDAADAARALAKAVGARTLILGPMANSHGLERIGVGPSHDRYDYASMLSGDARGLLLSQLDPAADALVARRLAELDLLVVHTSFLTETAKLAHVVLPAKTGYEKDGTTVNVEGRALPVRSAPVESGASEDLTGLLKLLGPLLGTRLDGRSTRSARRALKRLLDVDLSDIDDRGSMLPAPRRAAPAVRARSAVARPTGEALVTPSMVRIEYLDRNPVLRAQHGEAALRVHPEVARAHDLAPGEIVTLPVGGVPRRLRVVTSEAVPQGLWLVPALPDQPVGRYPCDPAGLVRESREAEVA